MTLGFVFESARSKRAPDDAPAQERMRGKGIRRRPDADQKKVRRQMLRTEQDQRRTAAVSTEESTTMSESFQQREAALLRRMASSNDLAEQRRLSEELEQVRSERTAAIAGAREVDLADTMIRDTFTPVAVHERHTAATDWVLEQQTGGYDAAAADHAMRTKATLWFESLIDEVKADAGEFAEQARGIARREAGAYGEDAIIVAQAFYDTAQRLRTQAGYATAADMPHSTPAGGQNGQGESSVTNYDAAPPDDQPFDSDFWSGDASGDAKAVHPDMPGAGEGQEQHVSRRAQAASDTSHCLVCGGETYWNGTRWLHSDTDKDHSVEVPTSDQRTSAKTAGVMVRQVGIAGPGVGSGVTADGTRITFRLSPEDEKDLKAVLYSDLAVNFSGVEIEQSDIISEQGGENSMTGPSRSAGLQTVAFTEFCKTCNAGLVGGPETGWKHAGPDGEKEDADHKPEPGGQGYSKSSSLQKSARSLREIANDIAADWGDKVNYAAKPYLDAMRHMDSINDKFGEDEGKWVVAYFLNNAGTYRGEKAKALKDELKALQKGASKTAARTATCAMCGKPIEYFDYSWYHLSADGPVDWETHGPQTYPAPGTEKEAAKTADVSPYASKTATEYAGGSPKAGDTATCHADGQKIEFFDGQWMHYSGGPSHNDVYPATPRERAEKESSLDMWGSLNTDAPVVPAGPVKTSGLIGLSAQGALQRLADDSGNGQNGNADSGLPDEPTGDTSKVMWPVELPGDSEDPKTGEGAADVANVATPGGESGYPQPSSKSSALTPEQAAFRARVQANLR